MVQRSVLVVLVLFGVAFSSGQEFKWKYIEQLRWKLQQLERLHQLSKAIDEVAPFRISGYILTTSTTGNARAQEFPREDPDATAKRTTQTLPPSTVNPTPTTTTTVTLKRTPMEVAQGSTYNVQVASRLRRPAVMDDVGPYDYEPGWRGGRRGRDVDFVLNDEEGW